MQGTRDPGRGSKHVIYLKGVVPLQIVKYAAAREQESDVHYCAPGGGEVAQIYVDKQKRELGQLEEVPRPTLMKYKEGVVGIDGKPVTATQDELKAASAKKEGATRNAKIEAREPIPTAAIKSAYFVGPQKGAETTFTLIMRTLKDKGQQISFNGVEGGQMRRCILAFEGDVPVLYVLYLDSEVLRPMMMANVELPANLAALKPKMEELMASMEKAELEPLTTNKVQQIEELFLCKAQGIAPKIEVEEKPPQVKTLEELLNVALS